MSLRGELFDDIARAVWSAQRDDDGDAHVFDRSLSRLACAASWLMAVSSLPMS
jgi:hypothetical protein